jgi:hypothetical protein
MACQKLHLIFCASLFCFHSLPISFVHFFTLSVAFRWLGTQNPTYLTGKWPAVPNATLGLNRISGRCFGHFVASRLLETSTSHKNTNSQPCVLLIIGIYFRCELVALRPRYFKPESYPESQGSFPIPIIIPVLYLYPFNEDTNRPVQISLLEQGGYEPSYVHHFMLLIVRDKSRFMDTFVLGLCDLKEWR